MPPKNKFNDPNEKRPRQEQQPIVEPEDLSGSDFSEDDEEDMLMNEGMMMFGDEGVVHLSPAQVQQMLLAQKKQNNVGNNTTAAAAAASATSMRLLSAGGEGATARDGQQLKQLIGAEDGDDDYDDDDMVMMDEGVDLDSEDMMLLDEHFGGDIDAQERFLKEFVALKRGELQQELTDGKKNNNNENAAAAGSSDDDEEDIGESAIPRQLNNGADDDDDNNAADDVGTINVNFSVDAMIPTDVDLVSNFLDGGYFPDVNRSAVDLTKFAAAIQKRGMGTSLVMTEPTEDEDDGEDEVNDSDDDDDDDEKKQELYGVLSMLRVSAAGDNNNGDVIQLLESASAVQPVAGASDAGAASPSALLRAGSGALVVSQLFSQLPPLLISRLYSCFVAEVTDSIKNSNNNNSGKKGGGQAAANLPAHVVFLSRVASVSADLDQDKTNLSERGDEENQANKARASATGSKKARVEKNSGNDDGKSGKQFVQFARFEEEVFYRSRDASATSVLMGRYTREAGDNRACVVFALKWSSFCNCVKQLEAMVAEQQ